MINAQPAPHIRHPENARSIMLDAVVTMFFLYIMAFYYHGPRAIMLAVVSIATSLATDLICTLLARRKPNPRDISALVTGMLLPLLMPASVRYTVLIVAVVFAIVVAKHPFGGMGRNVFNPAAAGFSFVVICFHSEIFAYPAPLEKLPVFGVVEASQNLSPAYTMLLGGIPKFDLVDMALGNYPGPMGATNILVILACLLYLVFRNTVRWEMPLAFFLTVAVIAWLFPRADDMTGKLSIMHEAMSGILLLGGVFMFGDPVTTPKRDWSKVAFGITAGIVVMLFRRVGRLEETFTFAVLLMNATVWGFDMIGERVASRVRRKSFGTFNN